MIIPVHHKRLGTHELLIDDEDYDKVKGYSWRINDRSNLHTFYARHTVYDKQKYIKRISIHRLIMGLGDYNDDKRQVNHIDGNGLNNHKSNLEICDAIHNSQSFRQVNRKSGMIYEDMSMKRLKRWRFCMTVNGKSHSKRFKTKEEAETYRDQYLEKLSTLDHNDSHIQTEV